MDDVLQRYGGMSNLTKHFERFYTRVCEDKGIKHYFFGIKCESLTHDLVTLRSFVMRKHEFLYRETPAQTAVPPIRVRSDVFEDVMKALQTQLKSMGIYWRDIPRVAHHIIEVVEETRSKPADMVKSTLDHELVSLDSILYLLKQKGVNAKLSQDQMIYANRGYNFSYPFWIQLSELDKNINLIGRGYARVGVAPEVVQSFLTTVRKRFPFLEILLKEDEEGLFIETIHPLDYSKTDIPVRMFLNVCTSFSWAFDEIMALDKDEQMINLVRDH